MAEIGSGSENNICQDYKNNIALCPIGKKYKISGRKVKKILEKNNIKIRSRSEAVTLSNKKPGHCCVKGDKNPNWKNGRNIVKGYIYIYNPEHPHTRKRYVAEHRLIIEKHLNRFLEKGETVHHINGDKKDNRIENLMLFSSSKAHSSYERKRLYFLERYIQEGKLIFKGD